MKCFLDYSVRRLVEKTSFLRLGKKRTFTNHGIEHPFIKRSMMGMEIMVSMGGRIIFRLNVFYGLRIVE